MESSLEHFELLAVFEADDEIRFDRRADRNRRLLLGSGFDDRRTNAGERCVNALNHRRHVIGRNRIIGEVRRYDIGPQR